MRSGELAPLAEEIERARADLQAQLDARAEVNRLQEQLLYDVSHELRAPLAALENALEMLATEFHELSARDFDHLLSSARRTAQRIRTLADNLLCAGNIQSGTFVVHATPTEPVAIVEEAVEGVALQLDARRQRVDRTVPIVPRVVLADQRYAAQALGNLLSNASKYSPEGAVIRLRVEQSAGEVCISVQDRGPGVAPEQQNGLFERFYRAHPALEPPGVGLGLAIVRGIVQAHGGRVGFETALGAGSRFWFTLPMDGPSE